MILAFAWVRWVVVPLLFLWIGSSFVATANKISGFDGEGMLVGRMLHLGFFLYFGRAWPSHLYWAYAALAFLVLLTPIAFQRVESLLVPAIVQGALLAGCFAILVIY